MALACLAAAPPGAEAAAGLGLVPLAARLRPADLLDHPRRRRLFEAVQAAPGSRVADLARETGMWESVVRHHLEALCRRGLVVSREAGRSRAFAPAARRRPDEFAKLLALRDPTRRRVAEALASSAAGLTQRQVCAALGISKRLASHHLRRLEREGLAAGEGPTPRRYVARAPLADLLAVPVAGAAPARGAGIGGRG